MVDGGEQAPVAGQGLAIDRGAEALRLHHFGERAPAVGGLEGERIDTFGVDDARGAVVGHGDRAGAVVVLELDQMHEAGPL